MNKDISSLIENIKNEDYDFNDLTNIIDECKNKIYKVHHKEITNLLKKNIENNIIVKFFFDNITKYNLKYECISCDTFEEYSFIIFDEYEFNIRKRYEYFDFDTRNNYIYTFKSIDNNKTIYSITPDIYCKNEEDIYNNIKDNFYTGVKIDIINLIHLDNINFKDFILTGIIFLNKILINKKYKNIFHSREFHKLD
jgi:hypothetical protein